MGNSGKICGVLASIGFAVVVLIPSAGAGEFRSSWDQQPSRIWIGPEYWANRLQDWRIQDGRLECVTPQRNIPLRTIYLLTRQLSAAAGEFEMSVECGVIPSKENRRNVDAVAGFLVGVGSGEIDHRAAALISGRPGRGAGILCGVDTKGRPQIVELEQRLVGNERKLATDPEQRIRLELSASQISAGSYRLKLHSVNPVDGNSLGEAEKEFPADRLVGNIGLVSHPGTSAAQNTAALFWFRDWQVAGAKLVAEESNAAGPIICTQYTLSRGVLKLTAQLMPLGESQPHRVKLQTRAGDEWEKVATSDIVVPGWTATFRVPNWPADRDVPFRVVYTDEAGRNNDWSGVVRRDPVDREIINVAGFTGNHSNTREASVRWPKGEAPEPCDWVSGVYFPHADVTSHVTKHRPDVLFFSGDQLYESDSPSFADRSNLTLDYMYKWYLWCWAYRDLTRDIPSVCIPDDHDVYQGNLWGQGGRKSPEKDYDGGYVHPAEWVNLVHRTQTSHLPDPFDPTPCEQNISVYYADMVYGRISFAIFADRQFKNGCHKQGLPPTGTHRPDHFNDPNLDALDLDIPGMKLLGDRQLEFLEHWAGAWAGADLKMALSQTIFANMATHHGPELFRTRTDLDSNGWPQSGRNRAVAVLRKGFAFHLGGDQHLATLVHHGIDAHGDANWSFAVPSVANFYPRAWAPKNNGKYVPPKIEDYTGNFVDGFMNKVTVYAASNPGHPTGREPAHLHDRMPGYGIVKLNKPARTITAECWPRYADPSDSSTGGQYAGWPRTINQLDNYARKPTGWLPELHVSGGRDPVVRIINEADGELVYALRIRGNTFQPHVFAATPHRIEVGETGAKDFHESSGVLPQKDKGLAGRLAVVLGTQHEREMSHPRTRQR